MSTFYIKKGDTSPSLRATLTDGSGSIVRVSGAEVRFHMSSVDSLDVKVDAAATIIDGENGVVEYAWSAADTDTTGRFYAEFEVTYIDSTVETFPNDGYFLVSIRGDLA